MKLWIIAAILCHLAAIALRAVRRTGLASVAFLAGGGIALAMVAADWIQSGQAPFSSMHHVMLALAASVLPAYTILVIGRKLTWLAPAFPVTGALPLILALLFRRDEVWNLAPALQSPWFIPHVIAYMVSYSLALLAFSLLVAAIVKRQPSSGKRTALEEGSYEVLSIAFPLMTFGMLSGALWADQVWGGYWSWDTKETWSLITWFLYLIYFHCRKTAGLKRYTNLAHGLAFAALITTFLLVNLLPKLASKLHSYV